MRLPTIEIVCHCYAGQQPIYADHLRYQLASLIRYPPQAQVAYTLFWAGPDLDAETAKLVLELGSYPVSFQFRNWFQPKELLFRRAFARHRRSQETTSDLIWYCDLDYFFGEGCIDSVCRQVKDDGRLWYPRKSLIAKDHKTGDSMVGRRSCQWPDVEPLLFEPQKNKIAIGGIQILGRKTANEIGYLAGTKWHTPVDPEKPFACFRDDCAWRRIHFKSEQKKQVAFDVPNLYRIRHEFSSLRPEGFAK